MLATANTSKASTQIMYFHTCINCGVMFGVPHFFDQQRREDGKSFHCPNGHRQCYTETESSRLRKQLEIKQTALEIERRLAEKVSKERDAAKRCAAAQKGQKTRIKNRIAKGICPCCNRSFSNIGAHMQQEHPHFTEQD